MSFLDRVFSAQHAKSSVENNHLMLIMYRLAYPFAVIFSRQKVSPDRVTTLSLLSAILAFVALVLNASTTWFCFFWGLAVLFDFCDGTVARISSQNATRVFRYDHMSDIFKISLVVVGIAIRFDSPYLWALTSVFLFVYLYSEIVSHDLKYALENSKSDELVLSLPPRGGSIAPQRIRDRVWVVGFVAYRLPFVYTFLLQCFMAISTFNGHTLLVFFALPLGGAITYVTLSYLTTLSLLSCMVSIRQLWRMRR